MKRTLVVLLGCFLSIAAMAQTVTIKVNGNRTQQVLVDANSYNIDNATTANNRTLRITDLLPGQHTIQIVRANSTRANTTTTFTLRQGYDISVVVAANGAVQVREKKATTTAATRTAMTDADFASTLRTIQNHWRPSSVVTAANNAFNNSNYYFTSNQAMQIIQSVPEANRLALAKLSYSKITDPVNFASVYTLISDPTNRDELVAYVRAQGGPQVVSSYSETFRAPMTDFNFTNLMNNIRNQWQANGKQNLITDVLSNSTTYFTVAQVRELISQLDYESSRLHLLKAAYSHVVDPTNFSSLYNLLSTSASQTELSSYIGAAANSGGLMNYNLNRIAMTDADFTSLYNKSRLHFRNSSVITEVTNAFANTSNYFTTAQAAQLIGLVSGESNRLQLAKNAYRTITNPENFLTQMNALLSLQSSEDELRNYVYAYRGVL
jgi:hypothetical protein